MGFCRRDPADDPPAEIHDINVTPFIDVMLVLLIIFMIAAPLSTVDIKVDLPSTTASPTKAPDNKPVVVTIRKDGTLAVGETDVTSDDLANALAQAAGHDTDRRIYVRADRDLAYGELVGVMDLLRGAGYVKVALVGIEKAPIQQSLGLENAPGRPPAP